MATERLASLTALIKRGITPSYVDEGGIIVLNQKCVRDNTITLAPARLSDVSVKPVPGEKYLAVLDILVNSTGEGTLGRVAQLRRALPGPATVDGHVTIVRPDPARVVPEYLGIVLFSRQDEIEDMAEGSTGQTELAPSALAEMMIDLPGCEDQQRIARLFHTIELSIENAFERVSCLRRIRDTVLPDLIDEIR